MKATWYLVQIDIEYTLNINPIFKKSEILLHVTFKAPKQEP